MLKLSGTNRQRAATLLMAVLCLVVVSQAVVLAQNLGAAPQVNVAVQGQTGAQPEGALTLRKCESFEVGQRPAWSADQILSADILFAATLDVNAPAPRRWRPNEARISLMGDATSGSAIRFEN